MTRYTLYINTASFDEIIIAIFASDKKIIQKKFKAAKSQAEKLLPAIDKLLKLKKINLSQLQKIVVVNSGGSFTSLRIGVVTANTLGYALNIPVESEAEIKTVKKFSNYSIVEPIYNAEPNIGKAKPLVY
jgi:tRNA threonylcarbamoyl adenosine modification protein YeaZ